MEINQHSRRMAKSSRWSRNAPLTDLRAAWPAVQPGRRSMKLAWFAAIRRSCLRRRPVVLHELVGPRHLGRPVVGLSSSLLDHPCLVVPLFRCTTLAARCLRNEHHRNEALWARPAAAWGEVRRLAHPPGFRAALWVSALHHHNPTGMPLLRKLQRSGLRQQIGAVAPAWVGAAILGLRGSTQSKFLDLWAKGKL